MYDSAMVATKAEPDTGTLAGNSLLLLLEHLARVGRRAGETRPCEGRASGSIDAEAFAAQAAVDVMAKTIHRFVMLMTLRACGRR